MRTRRSLAQRARTPPASQAHPRAPRALALPSRADAAPSSQPPLAGQLGPVHGCAAVDLEQAGARLVPPFSLQLVLGRRARAVAARGSSSRPARWRLLTSDPPRAPLCNAATAARAQAMAQWSSWRQLKSMSKPEAMNLYVRAVGELHADWWSWPELGLVEAEEAVEEGGAPEAAEAGAEAEGAGAEPGAGEGSARAAGGAQPAAGAEGAAAAQGGRERVAPGGEGGAGAGPRAAESARPAVHAGLPSGTCGWQPLQTTGLAPRAHYRHAAAVSTPHAPSTPMPRPFLLCRCECRRLRRLRARASPHGKHAARPPAPPAPPPSRSRRAHVRLRRPHARRPPAGGPARALAFK